MKKAVKKNKSIDYRHFIFAGLAIGLFTLVGVYWQNYLPRSWISLKVLGQDLYFFLVHTFAWWTNPAVPEQTYSIIMTSSGGTVVPQIPADVSVFMQRAWASFVLLFNLDYLKFSVVSVRNFLVNLIPLLDLFIILFALASIWYSSYFHEDLSVAKSGKLSMHDFHNNPLYKSKPLRMWDSFVDKVIDPIKKWIYEFITFALDHKWYVIAIAVAGAFLLNIVPVAMDVCSIILFWASTIDFMAVYQFVVIAVLDLYPLLSNLPLIVYLFIAYLVFKHIREKIGYDRLDHMENYDEGFVNSTGISTLLVGVMGAGKTLTLTDMILSFEKIIRGILFDIIRECSLLFYHFPWRQFERALEKEIKAGKIFNRTGVKDYVKTAQSSFSKKHIKSNIFGYDFQRYPLEVDSGLGSESIWSVLSDYGQAYFVYIQSNPLAVANYRIRFDPIKQDHGHFPMWIYDFFRLNTRTSRYFSRKSKVLDMNSMRLGKKVDDEKTYSFVLEACAIAFSEMGKERGNQFDVAEMKKNDGKANQKNDLFNSFIKLLRHFMTIRHRCIGKLIGDEQRVGSINSDLVQVCQDVISVSVGDNEFKLALPWFKLEQIICEWIIRIRNNFSDRYRFVRDDQTLLAHFLNAAAGKANLYMMRVINTFGFKTYQLSRTDGMQTQEADIQKYYIMTKKIFSDRYTSDCYNALFDEGFRKSEVGFVNLPEYQGSNASLEELESQHSYFIGDLIRIFTQLFAENGPILAAEGANGAAPSSKQEKEELVI